MKDCITDRNFYIGKLNQFFALFIRIIPRVKKCDFFFVESLEQQDITDEILILFFLQKLNKCIFTFRLQ